jgi:hypothetical protein
MDFLTTYTHDSELQVITALLLIYTFYKLLHAKSSPACSAFTCRCLVTAPSSEESSASVLTSLLSGEYPTTELSTELQRHLFSASLEELNFQLTGFPHCLHYNPFSRTE